MHSNYNYPCHPLDQQTLPGARIRTETRALIVEDERALRLLYGQIQESGGFSVVLAASGREALEVLEAEEGGEFGVIVSDITMPDMDGIGLLRSLRQRGWDTPVILVTGSPAVESAVSALEYGAMRYLCKPVNRRELIDLASRATALQRLSRLRQQAATYLGAEAVDPKSLGVSFARGLDSLWIAYQPIVNPIRQEVVAFEALVRTQEPSIPQPGVLFSIAERLGRIQEVGAVIRSRVAQTLTEHQPQTDIFLNLHSLDLLDEGLYSAAAPLSTFADQIILEITERAALEQVGDIAGRISRLRQLGFRLAIDDLGAGYSGLNYFALLSPDIVKLDISLIRNIHQDGVKAKIVGSLCTLCRELGIGVVGEGIEVAAEALTASQLGCDLLQGYFFARPDHPFPQVIWPSL